MCAIAALGVKMLSWFDLLLCTSHTHVRRDCRHEGKSLKHGCPCAGAAVCCYYCMLILVDAGLSGCF